MTPWPTQTPPPAAHKPAEVTIGDCLDDDMFVAVIDGDLFVYSGIPDGAITRDNWTETLDLAVTNPDIYGCQVVAETPEGLYLLGNETHYQLTTGVDDHNPSWASNGQEIFFDRGDEIWSVDSKGTAISYVGKGHHPLIANNGMMAWTDTNGYLIVEGKPLIKDAIGVNWTASGDLIYEKDGLLWVYNFRTFMALGIETAIDSAPNPHVSGGYKAVEEYANSLWYQNRFLEYGTDPDWWSSDPVEFDTESVINWINDTKVDTTQNACPVFADTDPGVSLVDFLKRHNQPSDKESRQDLKKACNIDDNYQLLLTISGN